MLFSILNFSLSTILQINPFYIPRPPADFITLLLKLAMQLLIQERCPVLLRTKLAHINLDMLIIMPELIPIPAHHHVNTELHLVLIPIVPIAELIPQPAELDRVGLVAQVPWVHVEINNMRVWHPAHPRIPWLEHTLGNIRIPHHIQECFGFHGVVVRPGGVGHAAYPVGCAFEDVDHLDWRDVADLPERDPVVAHVHDSVANFEWTWLAVIEHRVECTFVAD